MNLHVLIPQLRGEHMHFTEATTRWGSQLTVQALKEIGCANMKAEDEGSSEGAI